MIYLYMLCCNYTNQNKIINHFSIINKQRWLIHDKLKKLNLEDNWEIQKLYIDDFKRSKILNKTYENQNILYNIFILKKTKKPNLKKTFQKLIKIWNDDPWMIKSPHINKMKKKIKIHQDILDKIVEDEIIVNI